MSMETAGRSADRETLVDAAVFEKGAICKDENENTKLCIGEATSNSGFAQSYMKALTSLTLNTTIRGPKFYCFECDYYLHTQLSMTTHMKMHRKPFCPICFKMFPNETEVHVHIAEEHSMLFPNVLARPVVRLDEAIEKGEDYGFQTEVPPNSPTAEYKHRSNRGHGLGTINSSSISFLIAEKLRQHQEEMKLGKRSKPRKARNYRDERERLLSIAGVTGKVHKANAPKPGTPRISGTKSGEETGDVSLKRLTSRFGRVISLKVPQF